MTSEVLCRHCGHKHKIETRNIIHVGECPELKEMVRDGSLFVWECPDCGTANLARYQTLYHDPENRLMIWLLPPGSVPPDQEAALETRLKTLADSISGAEGLEGYVLRRVEEAGSLIEKVNIFDAGLDDIVMEMCKYVTRMEMSGDAPALKFYRIENADNDLIFTYPKDGEMQGARVGFNVYEDCAGILRRNPAIAPSPGFARVDADWIAVFFR